MGTAQLNFRTNGTHGTFQDMRFDFAHNGKSFGIVAGLQELNWKRAIERGEERANGSPFVQDVGTGEVSNEGNAVWLREAWDTFLEAAWGAQAGLFDIRGTMTTTYRRKNGKLVTIVITDLMIKAEDSQNKTGTDLLKVNVDLQIVGQIFVNGMGVFYGHTL
jgi:hypothetical protein